MPNTYMAMCSYIRSELIIESAPLLKNQPISMPISPLISHIPEPGTTRSLTPNSQRLDITK